MRLRAKSAGEKIQMWKTKMVQCEDNGAPDGKTPALKQKQPAQYQHRKNSLNCNKN